MSTGPVEYINAHKRYARVRAVAHSCTLKKFQHHYPSLILGNITHQPDNDPLAAYRKSWRPENRFMESAH